MIQVRELTKMYGQVKAVDRVSFEVEEGEILGFLGPNGAGKTTTMRMLTCYMPASSGTATVAGHDIFTESLAVRRSVGFMPENVPMYTDMTTREYLTFVSEIKGVKAGLRKQAVNESIQRCNLEAVADRLIRNLSKGYKQRVGLGQAIINRPPVLILDEPTSGLDPRQIIEIRNLIKLLAEHSTIILSTHILPEVSMTCTKVAIINRGRMLAFGPLDQIVATSGGEGMEIELIVEAPEAPLVKTLKAATGVASVEKRMESQGNRHFLKVNAAKDADPRKQLAALICAQEWGLVGLHSKTASLEDLFVKLISAEADVQSQGDEEDGNDLPGSGANSFEEEE